MATIGERVIGALGGLTRKQAQDWATRAAEAAYQDAGEDEPISGTTRKQGYNALASGAIKDLGGLDYGQVLDAVWKIYLSNPVARRYLHIKRDYILGGGIQVTCDDEDLKAILDEFWAGNRLDARLRDYVLQLFLLGEQMYPVFVRKSDGRVRLGYIDPSEIERVITHPENVLEKWAVVLKERLTNTTDPWAGGERRRVYRIVRQDEGAVGEEDVTPGQHEGYYVTHDQATLEDWETVMLGAYGLSEYTGSCLYFSLNDLSNQPRGYSDLLQVADWLDQLDAILFALADREQMADYFSFDVTLEGADEAKINERARKFRLNPPKKGSVNVHNERETWNLNRPDLKQTGSVESAKTVLTFILGGMGLPRSWYGWGDETNRATAESQASPTWRSMEHDQDAIRDVVAMLLEFTRDQAVIAGTWREDEEVEVEVVMPEMSAKDMGAISDALAKTANALSVANNMNLQTQETAVTIWSKVVAEIGVEIDPAEELEKLEAEAEEEELAQADDMNQAWQMQLNQNGGQPPDGQTPPQLAPFAQMTQKASSGNV